MTRGAFDDLLAGNAEYAATFTHAGLSASAARGLAIVTCMDARVAPLAVLGLGPGDAKVLRNAGARVTEDVLRTLVLAVYLLGVNRVLVMPHTDCRMASATEDEMHALIDAQFGIDTRSLEFRTVKDQVAALEQDLVRIRSYPLLPKDLPVGGAIYEVTTGVLGPIEL
jgi:carbonic anhydrase